MEMVGKGCVETHIIGLSGDGNIQTAILLFTDLVQDIKSNQKNHKS